MENQQVNTSMISEISRLPLLDSFNVNMDQSFHDSDGQIDEDRCYLMEIEQLKRQNNFLKKKLAEVKNRLPALSNSNKKKKALPPNVKPYETPKQNPVQNYIINFFQEITRLLESFNDLFKMGIQSSVKQSIEKQNEAINHLTAQNNSQLSRRLSRMLLQPEEKRYGDMLAIFESYYSENMEKNILLRNKVDLLTIEAIELGKRMVQNIKNKQKIKSSHILSSLNDCEDGWKSDEMSLKSSIVKSTCTDSQIDLSHCRIMLGKEKMFETVF